MNAAFNGLILIDKPRDLTSAEVSLLVKKELGVKAAHCGTLDPQVTGVLPILVGKGIKLLEFLQEHDKEYVCTMQLEKPLSVKEIEELFQEFTGNVYQKPPEKAAVARRTRRREIYSIELLDLKERIVRFKIKCQHGTYIRTLVKDFERVLGQKIKLVELRRIKVNGFDEKECIIVEQFRKSHNVLPMEEAVRGMPRIVVKKSAVKMLKHGTPLMMPGVVNVRGNISKETAIVVFDENKKLVGVGKALCSAAEMKNKKKGRIVDMKKVLI
jgi:H/ACA ribonucleoprotein complex subunit 4